MPAPPVTKWVYDFEEGSRGMRDLLGGKGANVAEMTRVLGPELVPAGFTITTDAGVAYMRAGRSMTEGFEEPVADAMARLEDTAGKRFGDPEDPLLVSVRSGARDSMPGMMDSVLTLGLNDDSVKGRAARTGNERFAWDSYRRLVQMFGDVVRGVPGVRFQEEIARVKRERGSASTPSWTRMRCARSRDGCRRSRLPGRSPRAADPRHPRRVRLMDGRARRRLPPHPRDPRRLGHRRQRAADGLRQQGPDSPYTTFVTQPPAA